MINKNYTLNSIEDLHAIVKDFIPLMSQQNIWAFVGEMGAGKTTFIKELCTQLGVEENEVNSPTFAIVNEYQTSELKTIYHFDFYRINREEEALDFGYEEYFYSGNLCLVEWPQKIASLMPSLCGIVKITIIEENKREISITVESIENKES